MLINGKYHNLFFRILHSFFIEMPAKVWFRFLSHLIPSSAQFVNYTNVSDAVLLAAWKQAQTHLGTQSFPDSAYGPANHPADPRALTIQPSNVAVVSVPDTKISDLAKVDPAWGQDKDPSRTIIVPIGQGFLEYQACAAMTFTWARPRVYAAASQIPDVLSYEFESIILSKLGFNVENR
jgi:hypothetical protein